MIYEGRPLACRTHFCVPAGGALPRREVIDLIHALEDIDAALAAGGLGTAVPKRPGGWKEEAAMMIRG